MESIINNKKTKLKLLTGFGLGITLIVIVQLLSGRSINSIIKNEKALLHTTKTIEQIGALKANVSSFESKMRGYVLTSNQKFLDGNDDVQEKSYESIRQLLAASSIKDHDLLEELNRLVIAKIKFNRRILTTFSTTDNSHAASMINSGEGKLLMDSISGVCERAVAVQRAEAERYKKSNDLNSAFALNADLISGIIILICLIISLRILFKDINNRIRLENDLREEQKKTEKTMQIREQFMSNMSHEIRTPLNAVLGFSGLLENTPLNEQQRDYLQAVNSAGKSLMTIVNDILDFSKIEAGMLGIENVPFSLQQLMQSVYTMFFPKAQSKDLKLYLSIDPKIPMLVSGDPTRLNQVIMNLIGNAVKFTNKGSINVDCSVIALNEKQVQVKISIKDTGIGIIREKTDTIFDRFTQADNATTRNFGGTGLGLSIAKKLVELQGGEIHVNSTPGKGSEFYFTLAYAIVDAKDYVPVNGDKSKNHFSKGKKVLIVEDNPLNQKLAQMLLENAGIETSIAVNGQVAVEALKANTFDVILMDIQMPVLDGYEATKKIRNELQIGTPIIAMTANAMSGEYERCISSGMNDYITKPFRAETLLNSINAFFNKNTGTDKTVLTQYKFREP